MNRKALKLFTATILITFLFCGKSALESGDAEFQNGNYGKALEHYLRAAQIQPDNEGLKEKIARSYFKLGAQIYNRAHVIPAYEDRIKHGKEYLPDSLSGEMKQTLSDVYYDLAIAYNEAVPENNYQKKKYFEETISNLETAIGYNPENADAQRALEQFKTDHFRELLDKGIANYNKGKQDPINYLTADYYLTNARKLDPENADAKKYLRLVRQKNLNILDPGQDVPLAVTDQKRDENIQAYHIILHNQSGESIPVSPENFYLITNSGKEIQGSWSEKYQPVFPTKVLATNQEVEGVVTFDAGNARDFSRLEFRHGENVPGYKNLP